MLEQHFSGEGKPETTPNPQRDLPKSPQKKSAGEVHRPPTPEEVLRRGIDRIIEKRERKKTV